jgi:hypothetical protein
MVKLMIKYFDPIIAEVRKNREDLLAEFDGDTKKLTAYLNSRRSEMESAGLRFETPEERDSRLAWNKKRQEEKDLKVANL